MINLQSLPHPESLSPRASIFQLARLEAKRLSAAWFVLAVFLFGALANARAASQTWTNAPVDANWTNVNNWVGKGVPGDINATTANTVNADIATFNSPLFGGIGGAGNPIVPDDATIVNGRSRRISSIIFDTVDCGPYVISSPSPAVPQNGSSPATGVLYVSHNGSIVMSNSVANSQQVLIPLYVNLPASTAGAFNLVNNSTNPSATLTVSSITHAGATTRATTFFLDGTNSGNNIVTNLSEGGGNNTGGITKRGPGTWIIAGPGTFPSGSPINVNDGLLIVRDPGAFGVVVAATLVVTNTGVLQIDGVTLNNTGLTLRNGGTVRMNGVGTLNGVVVGNTVGTSVTLATKSAGDVFTVGGTTLISGGAVDTVLHLAGPGMVQFATANTFLGRYSVDSGTNQLTTDALGAAANLNINAGATFDVSPLGPTTYALSAKALSANGTGTAIGSTAATIIADPGAIIDLQSKPVTLTFMPTSFSGDTAHPALYIAQGTLSGNGNGITVNNASGTPLGAGTYRLVRQQTGSIISSGGFVAIVTGSGLAPGLVGEIVANGGDLNLIVSAYTPKSLVWKGGNPDSTWDRLTTANWLDGVTPSTFNIYDAALFNSVGAANPNVNLAQTLVPNSVVVDTTAANYTFSGPGQIAGGAGLTKVGTGTLTLQTANTYSGGTIISNGVVVVGVDNALPNTGNGDVALYSPAKLEMNGFSDTINALNGNGTIDVSNGGTSILTVGENGNSGTFSGTLQNTSGTLGLTKTGNGTETLTASNSYSGTTIIDLGTLRVTNINALGTSAVIITNGTLDLATSLRVTSIDGAAGAIVNNSTAATVTNILAVLGNSTSGSLISGRVGILVSGGTLRLNAANTYSGGTIVASGAGLSYGNLGQSGSGGVIASNAATIALASANNPSSAVAANHTTVDGATVTFTSGTTANTWNGQFIGSASATNIFANGNMSIGGSYSFSNFLGTVVITNGGVRWFNALSGGDNTTFIFINGGGGFTRDATIVRLGALFGNGSIGNPSVTPFGTYWIGAKGIDSVYSGTIAGSNNIVKVGAGKLTFNGAPAVTNTDEVTFTNYLYSGSALTYIGNTTVSNGVLAIVAPNTLSNSPVITVAGVNALLDASQMGYVSNFLSIDDGFTPTNSVIVTDGIFPINFGQTLAGIGNVKASRVINSGTINPGFAGLGGTLTISNNLSVLSGATNYFDLSDDLTGVTTASDVLQVQGNVNLSGSSVIAIGALNGVLKAGKYPLIKYSGSLMNEGGVVGLGPISNFTLGGTFTDTSRATMVLSNAPGEVDLIVVSLNTHNLTWTGDGVSNWWDVITSQTWSDAGNPSGFYQLDAVTFLDTANNYAVLQGTLVPSSVLVSNANTFGFGGTGGIGGTGSFIKTGAGALIFTNGASSYTGGTIISNGLVSLGTDSGNNQNDRALGTGPIVVNSGAELRFGGNGGGTVVHHFITNPTTINGGLVKAADGGQHFTNSPVTITAAGGNLQTAWATKNLILDSALTGTGSLTISAANGTNAAGGQVILNNPTNNFSGSVTIATNGNLALVGPAGLSNVTSIDVQLGGILEVSARTNIAGTLTLQSGQTLGGRGLVRGTVTALAGSTIAPGGSGIGTLTITNSLNMAGQVVFEIDRAATQKSDLINATNLNAGGTLTVINNGAALQLNDTFQLFGKGIAGAFAITNLPALTTGLIWNNTLAVNGRLTVAAAVNTNPTNITFSASGGTNLTLSWPADHIGWRLQAQTNALSTGLTTNWSTVAGSTTTNQIVMPVNPTNGAVFFRLVYP